MSWYRDNDGKIITNEEFQNNCTECSCSCQEGTTSAPCDGERTDCPYFKEVGTSEYDKEIRNKVITEFAERLKREFFLKSRDTIIISTSELNEIAEEMRGAE